MKDDNTNPPDDFSQDLSGWHELLGWGDGTDSVAPYVPTPMSVVHSMLELIEAGPGDTLIDLGCGDGRILIMAVEEFNVARAIGYELNKHLVETAEYNIKEKGLGNRIQVIEGNFMEADLSPATIVTLYLTTTGNAKLRPKFIEELREGARIISHDFPIIDWIISSEDKQPIRVGTHKIFIYKMPEAYENKPAESEKASDRWHRIKKILERLEKK
ncbi:MAG: class I SAM-dependent methyltransferase [Candidatus Bathyarchaeota archaeon]|nr:class I SAM-dependent methyltransferase [Candidatus Bathyarchaeota archaeon]